MSRTPELEAQLSRYNAEYKRLEHDILRSYFSTYQNESDCSREKDVIQNDPQALAAGSTKQPSYGQRTKTIR